MLKVFGLVLQSDDQFRDKDTLYQHSCLKATMSPLSADSRRGNDNITPLPAAELAESSIQQFYKGATVFITGGTGFVGQLIIEKLLRCCPDLRKIYVLTRPRKGKDIQTRLEEQFESDIYDRLKEVNPNFKNQVEAIAGDCGELGLGISNDERSTLIDEVSVIFHSAATVRFDEPLKVAVAINTRGTREMVYLAKACKKLKALVHVSTAYTNCWEPDVEEKFYDAEMPGDKLIDMVENMEDDSLKRITAGLIARHPNTYTYTKKAAEDIVQKYARDIPCAVVRPSIITGTFHEPKEGWSGNVYGLGGAFLGFGMGIIHTMAVVQSNVIDIVPGDYVSNNCIAAAWQTARSHKAGLAVNPRIYMCGTSPQTPLLWNDLVKKSITYYEAIPSSNALYKVFYFLPSSLWMHRILGFFLHWVPAYTIDALLMLFGKTPILKKVYTKVDQMIEVTTYFAINSWVFHNENTLQLYRGMTKRDQEVFNFDFENLNTDLYLKTYVHGTRRYLLKDPDSTMAQGKIRKRKLDILHYCICSVLVLLLFGIFKLFSLFFQAIAL